MKRAEDPSERPQWAHRIFGHDPFPSLAPAFAVPIPAPALAVVSFVLLAFVAALLTPVFLPAQAVLFALADEALVAVEMSCCRHPCLGQVQ